MPGKQNGGLEAEDDVAIALDAVLKFPKSGEQIREELFTIADRLAEDAQAAAQQRASHDKRLEKLWSIDKRVMSFLRYLEGLSPMRRARADHQYTYAKEKLNFFPQMELQFLEPGSGEPDAGPVFDATPTGERHDQEPTRTRKDEPAETATAKKTADVMPLSSFREQLEANNAKVEASLKGRRKKAPAGKEGYTVVG